jgi:protein involved in plasmid replication-relaxation
MITNPTRQRTLRGHKATRPTPRAANNADHQAVLAGRLTPRDRWIIRMLHEHRVLTAHQITALAFPSFRSGRMRLRELFQWGVVDRFQPFITAGTAPMHYILAPAGATVLAAEDGLDIKELGYRHDRAFGIAHSLRLAHTVGVAEWFTALVDRARYCHTSEHSTLVVWWSEARCARHFGDLVKPDAYGRWANAGGRSSSSSSTTSAPRSWPSSPGNWPATPRSPRPPGSPPRCWCGYRPRDVRPQPAGYCTGLGASSTISARSRSPPPRPNCSTPKPRIPAPPTRSGCPWIPPAAGRAPGASCTGCSALGRTLRPPTPTRAASRLSGRIRRWR